MRSLLMTFGLVVMTFGVSFADNFSKALSVEDFNDKVVWIGMSDCGNFLQVDVNEAEVNDNVGKCKIEVSKMDDLKYKRKVMLYMRGLLNAPQQPNQIILTTEDVKLNADFSRSNLNDLVKLMN
ncbi:hypothetical protein [Aureibacter tunicatorum]|uniref:Uncharacterized protein n=1 Tax=Aureibacter tunicatorum TaxID=866807 RepID=A0AAE3XPK5_9BACT|nr:hypothetical protein [Aureibacter tunicatorum]MDR6239699.1 hypothetical protein [Aureibacter tunicatorum]BDD04175.1 hypothetical protein AUTU_16580 [Aureibacter tunicatorum]